MILSCRSGWTDFCVVQSREDSFWRSTDSECHYSRVFLHATDESALQNGITMEALKKFAHEPEAAGGGGSLEKKAPITPGTTGGIARETH